MEPSVTSENAADPAHVAAPSEAPPPAPPGAKKSAFGPALRWGVSLLLVAAIGYRLAKSWDDLKANPPVFRAGWIALATIVLAAFLVMAAEAWRRWILAFGVRIPFPTAFKAFYVSNLAKYLPGGVWNLVGRVAICQRAGLSASTLSITVLLEMASQIAGTTLLALPAIPALVRGHFTSSWPLLAIALALVIGLHPFFLNLALAIGFRILRRPAPRIEVRYPRILGMVLLYALNWSFFAGGFILLAQGLSPTPIDFERAMLLLGAFVISWNAGIVAFFLPAGLGVREGAMIMILGTAFPPGFAATLALVARVWILVVEIAFFGVAAIIPDKAEAKPATSS